MDFLSTDIATTPLAKVLEAAWQSCTPFKSAGLHRLNECNGEQAHQVCSIPARHIQRYSILRCLSNVLGI